MIFDQAANVYTNNKNGQLMIKLVGLDTTNLGHKWRELYEAYTFVLLAKILDFAKSTP